MALIDACVRLLPGVVGAPATLEEESFERGLLEYPALHAAGGLAGPAVPEVLLSGHHETDHGLAAGAGGSGHAEAAARSVGALLSPNGAAERRTTTDEPDDHPDSSSRSRSPSWPQARPVIPDFAPGDTLRVNVKVVEGTRERIQAFEGVCIAPQERRPELQLHRAQDLLRRGRRARVPAVLARARRDRGGAPRRGAPRQALLPARPHAASRRASPRRPAALSPAI